MNATHEERQKVLFSGLDCLPGQLDLFPTDGKLPEEKPQIRNWTIQVTQPRPSMNTRRYDFSGTYEAAKQACDDLFSHGVTDFVTLHSRDMVPYWYRVSLGGKWIDKNTVGGKPAIEGIL